MAHEMIQYFRGDGNHPIGIMAAIFSDEDNIVRIGWSKCNKKDQFEKERGFKIARARAFAGSALTIPVSREFGKIVNKVITVDKDPDDPTDIPDAVENAFMVIPNIAGQYEIFVRRIVTYFKSVPVENFYVCGQIPLSVIVDARNADLDRMAAREAK